MRKLTVILVLFLVTLPLMADSLDVTPTQMISPQEEQVGSFLPTALYAERAGTPVENIYCRYRIITLDTKSPVYEDSVMASFAAYEEQTVTFPPLSEPLDNACYEIEFWAIDNYYKVISYPPLVDTFCYTGIAETPASDKFNMEVTTSQGSQIILRYSGSPQGFRAEVFDASGRKVDELNAVESSGIATWGGCHGPGVYFICVRSERSSIIQKVILIQ